MLEFVQIALIVNVLVVQLIILYVLNVQQDMVLMLGYAQYAVQQIVSNVD